MSTSNTRSQWADAIEAFLRIFRSTLATAILLVIAVVMLILGFALYSILATLGFLLPIPAVNNPGSLFKSTGPTTVQLERIQYLASTRVRISDVMTGESRHLQGIWIVQGSALLGVDMKGARIQNKDEDTRTATVILPEPIVLQSRIDLETTREYSLKNKSWIPFAGVFVGDKEEFRKEALIDAQKLIDRAAVSDSFKSLAKENAEIGLREFFSEFGWKVDVNWQN